MSTIRVFQITSDNIDNFRRSFARPMDCLINALQLLGLVDSVEALNLRIQYGNVGFQQQEIVNYFNNYYNLFHCFSSYDNLQNILYVISQLPIGLGILCGVQFHSGEKHVFITAKDLNGNILVLDPQRQTSIVPLDDYLNNSSLFYILKY